MEQEPVNLSNAQSDTPPAIEPAAEQVNTPPPNPARAPIAAYCRSCGKGLSRDEMRTCGDTVYCEQHVPVHESAQQSSAPHSHASSPGYATPATSSSPGLAFMLGLIPGVGAIYNGQFAKAVVHLLITTLVASLAGRESGSMEPLFDMLVPVWVFYMALEAYHTAKKRQLGEPVDEFSSIFPAHGAGAGIPLLPILLIGLGVLFLLDNLQLLHLRQMLPYAGPLFLIALGVYMLYARLKSNSAREVSHERN